MDKMIIRKNDSGKEFEINMSEQAITLIENMPGFNQDDFFEWFLDGLTIGSNNILMFLMDIKKKGRKNGK